jgi:primosomal replication protein N
LSHKSHGENFYKTYLEIARGSGTIDTIPVIISERVMQDDIEESVVRVFGEMRTHDKNVDGKRKHIVYVFAQHYEIEEQPGFLNEIHLDGYICKETVRRVTPLGREICDFLLAVNRPYGKADYIPCIAWGRNARYIPAFEIGKHISIQGRIQSRDYCKKLETGEIEVKTAYEVSVSSFMEEESEIANDERRELDGRSY